MQSDLGRGSFVSDGSEVGVQVRTAALPLMIVCVMCLAACHPQPSCAVFDTRVDDASITSDAAPRSPRVLIYAGLTGFRHDSIPTAVESLAMRFASIGVSSDRASDPTTLASTRFESYGAVVFVSTTGQPLGAADSPLNLSLLSYVQRGGGFVGIHAVDDAYDGCGPFNAIVGGWFAGHPGDTRQNDCVTHGTHPALGSLPASFRIEDEFHLLWNFRGDNVVLVSCETDDHTSSMPVSWVRDEGAGRVFVTTLGHPDATYADSRFVDHVLAGTAWVLRR